MLDGFGAGWGLKELGHTCAVAGTGIAVCLLLVLVGALVSVGWSAGWLVAALVVLGVAATTVGLVASLLARPAGRTDAPG